MKLSTKQKQKIATLAYKNICKQLNLNESDSKPLKPYDSFGHILKDLQILGNRYPEYKERLAHILGQLDSIVQKMLGKYEFVQEKDDKILDFSLQQIKSLLNALEVRYIYNRKDALKTLLIPFTKEMFQGEEWEMLNKKYGYNKKSNTNESVSFKKKELNELSNSTIRSAARKAIKHGNIGLAYNFYDELEKRTNPLTFDVDENRYGFNKCKIWVGYPFADDTDPEFKDEFTMTFEFYDGNAVNELDDFILIDVDFKDIDELPYSENWDGEDREKIQSGVHDPKFDKIYGDNYGSHARYYRDHKYRNRDNPFHTSTNLFNKTDAKKVCEYMNTILGAHYSWRDFYNDTIV